MKLGIAVFRIAVYLVAYICFRCMAPVVESDAVNCGTCLWQRGEKLYTVLSAAQLIHSLFLMME
jgi:hypothetical protein